MQRFNHGKGFVIGHQWTNIVLVINDHLIPLPPIPFYTKRYCAENNIKYRTENENVCYYLHNLKIEDYVGAHKRSEVVVLADSGYDDKRIENTIVKKGWKFIIALNKTRSVKSEKQYSTTPKSKYWRHVSEFFKRQRCIPWQPIHIPVNRAGKKRMEFRLRQIIGYLRYVGKAQLICSEFKKKAHGRRKYLACNDLNVTARQILIGYRLRWLIEIFHKHIKMFLGFEDVATKSFQSVISYVHWVYCAYILLNSPDLPAVPDTIGAIEERQKYIQNIIALKDKARIHQLLTRFNGVETYKAELRQALEET